MRRAAVALATALFIVGCGDDSGTQQGSGGTFPSTTVAGAPTTTVAAPPSATAEPACDRPAPAGETPESLRFAGERRTYLLDVPEAYDGNHPTGLIVDLHGFGSSAVQQSLYSDLGSATDMVVVTPQGLGEPARWSLAPGPANPDIRFVRRLVAEVSSRLCIDPTHVHATGISNGSALSAEIACAAPDVFASVALVAATVPPLLCDPGTRIPVLAFHGTADPVVPYAGGQIASIGIADGLRVPPAEDAMARWAEQDGCPGQPQIERIGGDVAHWTWEGCEADVEFYSVEGAGHVWPGAISRPDLEARLGANTETIDTSALISEWFSAHPQQG